MQIHETLDRNSHTNKFLSKTNLSFSLVLAIKSKDKKNCNYRQIFTFLELAVFDYRYTRYKVRIYDFVEHDKY